jgi:hypothetical protein
MRPSGNRISARVPGGTSTCRFSAPSRRTGLDEEVGLDAVLDEMVRSTERLLAQPGLIELSVLLSAEASDA